MPGTNRPLARSRTVSFAIVFALLLATSCASIGPKTIPRDQFDYGRAIANSSKEQLLSNVVGLRYIEAPVFVNVSSVINQYSLEGEVQLGAAASNSVINSKTLTVGGSARYADRPTITYMPVTGQTFARSLLTPLPPEALFALVQAGWSPEIILSLTVRSMNRMDNAWAAPVKRRQADPRFIELLQVWSRLHRARALGLRHNVEGEDATIVVYTVSERVTAELEADLRFLHEALGLDPAVDEYTLSYGRIPDDKNEITVFTSSILQVMNELAWRIEVPPEHIEEGRTGTTFREADSEMPPLIRVHYSKERPEQSYVAIKNRDYWFYVDDRDVVSKRVFAMVQVLLSLTESGETARGPVLSISN